VALLLQIYIIVADWELMCKTKPLIQN